MEEIEGVTFIHGDIHSPLIQTQLSLLFANGVDIVMSDMAHKFTGLRVIIN